MRSRCLPHRALRVAAESAPQYRHHPQNATRLLIPRPAAAPSPPEGASEATPITPASPYRPSGRAGESRDKWVTPPITESYNLCYPQVSESSVTLDSMSLAPAGKD